MDHALFLRAFLPIQQEGCHFFRRAPAGEQERVRLRLCQILHRMLEKLAANRLVLLRHQFDAAATVADQSAIADRFGGELTFRRQLKTETGQWGRVSSAIALALRA